MTEVELVNKALELKKELGEISPSFLARKLKLKSEYASKIFYLVQTIYNNDLQ